MTTRYIGFSDLIQAVYTRLTTHDSTKSYNTYNYVPDDATFPYISIGTPMGTRSGSFSSQDIEGEDNVIMIDVWSDYYGDKECGDMMNDIATAITSSSLSISGYTQILGLIDYYDIMIDDTEPANPIRHGLIRVRFHMA